MNKRLYKIEEFKDLKEVYGIPTGNNAQYNKETKKFEILKVKRKYITVRIGDYTPFDCDVNGREKSDYNAGFMFYRSLEDVEYYKSRLEKNRFLSDELRFANSFNRLSDKLIDMMVEELKEQ